MNEQKKYTIDDLMSLFEDVISPADAIAAKLMAQVSSAITRERIKLRMTQTEFAKHIGVTQSQVSRWEHGDYNFSLEKIADIAAKLDLEVNFSAITMSAYKGLDMYSSNHFITAHTFIYKASDEKENNLSYVSKDIIPTPTHIKSDAEYVNRMH